MFTVEEKLFLKQLGIKDRKSIIEKIESIEADDNFSKEFLNDILEKLLNSKKDMINI